MYGQYNKTYSLSTESRVNIWSYKKFFWEFYDSDKFNSIFFSCLYTNLYIFGNIFWKF